jgi:ligand-binding sensor domain-containing protein
MKKTSIIYIVVFLANNFSTAQNLFQTKLENCNTEKFCLDCGDEKASYKSDKFEKLLERLNKSLNLKGIKGLLKLQVLVDSKGKGCVLSHTDKSNNIISRKIVEELNNFNDWLPAKTGKKKEEKVSITLLFTVKDDKLSGVIERVDIDAFKMSFDKPTSPEIFNKSYVYKNESLSNYKFTIWNSKNSALVDNSLDHFTFDKNGLLWLIIDNGVQTFDGKDFKSIETNPIHPGVKESYFAITSDNNNTIWLDGLKSIYSFNSKWNNYDLKLIGIDGAYDIVNNEKTNEVYFCSDKGLTIFSNGIWKTINKETVPEFPSNRVYYAKKDSNGRIWIGTFDGTLMIDESGKATSFEKSDSILKGKCITSMDEDENGNLYFSLYEFGDNVGGKVNRNEGIAIRYADGTIKQFTTENSGMPFNHTNCVVYDKNEKCLWISTDRAGLVKYDLKENWENYHNENSSIPTSYISSMAFDKNGNLFLATRQGLVKMERK